MFGRFVPLIPQRLHRRLPTGVRQMNRAEHWPRSRGFRRILLGRRSLQFLARLAH